MSHEGEEPDRELIAEGYIVQPGKTAHEAVLVTMDGEAYGCTIDAVKLPARVQKGSLLRVYEGTGVELYEPVWTKEDLDRAKQEAKKLAAFFDLPEDE